MSGPTPPKYTYRRQRDASRRGCRLAMAHALLIVGFVFAASGPAGAAESTGTVVIVHGLQGIDADLYLDGASSPALTSFTFRRVTDPLSLQPGLHRAEVRAARSAASSAPLLTGTFTVTAGQRVTVAALLDAAGQPSWLAFPNDAWTFPASDAQIRFRHLAETGPVSLVVDGISVITGAANLASTPPSGPLELPAGVHQVAVFDTASGAAVIRPQQINVAGGSIVNLYLTGRAAPASLELLLQGASGEPAPTVAVAARVLPDTIDTGDSGLLSQDVESNRRTSVGVTALITLFAIAITVRRVPVLRHVPAYVRRSR